MPSHRTVGACYGFQTAIFIISVGGLAVVPVCHARHAVERVVAVDDIEVSWIGQPNHVSIGIVSIADRIPVFVRVAGNPVEVIVNV